jgi:hypothetical protein
MATRPGRDEGLRGIASSAFPTSLLSASLATQPQWWVEKQGAVGVPLPTSDQQSDLQICVRSANTSLRFLSRVTLQRGKSVLRNLDQKRATLLGFSTRYALLFQRGEQAPRE